jgi:hypothetical protein
VTRRKLSSGDPVLTNTRYAAIVGNQTPHEGVLLREASPGTWLVRLDEFYKLQRIHETLMEVDVTKKTAAKPKEFKWRDDPERVGTQWLADVTSEPQARIRISSRNSDGSYSYFCYRNNQAVRIVHDLDAAKRACEAGKQPKISDPVLDYVMNHRGDLPPFQALTEAEQRAVLGQYPYAAPSAGKLRRGAAEGRGGSSAERRGLAEEASGAAGRAARAQPKPRTADLAAAAEGRLARLAGDNPKRPGSGAHARWEALFAACAAGSTVQAFAAAGGNLDTLANAVAKGYVKVEETK